MTSLQVAARTFIGRLAGIPSRVLWGSFAVLIASLPMSAAISTTRVFCLRDLSFYFWPEHLWVRNSLSNGEFPLWDPYVGFGQVAFADPVRHLLYPPIALLRFVPSAVLGFNLAVALPFPVAAAGTYLFLRRRVGDRAAALGAIVFAISGPMLSTSNMLNLSWSVATIPWALLAVDMLVERPTARRFACTAMVYAMFLLACEGTTLVGGAFLTATYAIVRATPGTRIRAGARVVAAGFCGIALAGVLFVPFLMTTLDSPRAEGIDPRVPAFWSLHPLSLVQSVSYGVLGDPIGESGDRGWIGDLNGYPEPFIYSIYLGIGVLALVALGFASRRRTWEGWYWAIAAGFTLFIAFGRFVPLYGILRSTFPIIDALRFPVKFVVMTAFALAVLAAFGWDSLEVRESETARPPIRPVVWTLLVCAVGTGTGFVLVISGHAMPALRWLADVVGTKETAEASRFLQTSLSEALPQLCILFAGFAAAFALSLQAPKLRTYGMGIVFAIAILDPAFAGWELFPQADARNLVEPPWAGAVRERQERVYVGGRLQFVIDQAADPDNVRFTSGMPLASNSRVESIACLSRYMATFPSAWRVRDAFSFDNAMLWPREYWQARNRFRTATHEERLRFLRRAGVGSYLVTWPTLPEATVVHREAMFEPLALWQLNEPSPRTVVTQDWEVEPDTLSALNRSFDERTSVIISEASSPGGASGTGAVDASRIVADEAAFVAIDASSASDNGVLVVRDSFSKGWSATIDGLPAKIVRADGLFRGVRLREGAHRVEFRYEPPGLRVGLAVTALTAMCLGALVVFSRRSER